MRKCLIIGRSGTGKSTSLRELENAFIVRCVNKELPYKPVPTQKTWCSDNYDQIKNAILKAIENGYKTIVLDDVSYCMTSYFMKNHGNYTGNGSFTFYNKLADQFYDLIDFIENTGNDDAICYFIMHSEVDESGYRKPKTIGKLLDDKVCIEGRFTIVLESCLQDNEYKFMTNTDGLSCCKSPMGMFSELYIPNNIKEVDKAIRDYYKGE